MSRLSTPLRECCTGRQLGHLKAIQNTNIGPLRSSRGCSLLEQGPAFLRQCSQEMDSTLWKIAPAMQREKPEQQPDTSMYGILPSCHLVLSCKQVLSGPHSKKPFAGSLKPARLLKLTKRLLDLLPNRLALFLCYSCEHLLKGSKGVSLEADTLRG